MLSEHIDAEVGSHHLDLLTPLRLIVDPGVCVGNETLVHIGGKVPEFCKQALLQLV